MLVVARRWRIADTTFDRSIGWFLSISTIVMNAIFQSFSIGSNVWLAKWSGRYENVSSTNETVNNEMYLGVYSALGLGQGK